MRTYVDGNTVRKEVAYPQKQKKSRTGTPGARPSGKASAGKKRPLAKDGRAAAAALREMERPMPTGAKAARPGNAVKAARSSRPARSANAGLGQKGNAAFYGAGNRKRKISPREQKRREQLFLKEQEQRELRKQKELAAREKAFQAQQERLRGKTVTFDLAALVGLTILSVVVIVACVQYVRLKTETNTLISSIEAKERTLEKLRAENEALEDSIYTSLDLDELYRVATQELGMVYAGSGQVITFDKSENGYVRQYEKIPKY